ncbi:uncharacterized protein LOC142417005 [Mycteria americana]|uniref:uncharacterized protein LOC142417005 n=1 Tax=Mycteria americana TaxID=33587 RepID=UPI003F58150F
MSVVCLEVKTRGPGLCRTAPGGHGQSVCSLKASSALGEHGSLPKRVPAVSETSSPFPRASAGSAPCAGETGTQGGSRPGTTGGKDRPARRTAPLPQLGEGPVRAPGGPGDKTEMPSAEEIKQKSSDEPDSDSKFEDEATEEENQNETSSIETQEETQSSGSLGKLRPKPAYLSSKPTSQKQSLLAAISASWCQSQKIRPSHVEKNDVCNILMLLCTMLSSLTWNFVCQLLQISNVLRIQLLPSSLIVYMAQLLVLLGEKVVKILGSLRLESRGLLASVLGRRYKCDEAPRATSGWK